MDFKCEIVRIDNGYDDEGRELAVNQVLGNWASNGWTLVSTNVLHALGTVEVWLFFQRAA